MTSGRGEPLVVLVVSGGGYQGLTVMRLLRGAGEVRIAVADCNTESPGRYWADSYHVVPPVTAGQAFIDALAAICRRESARLLIPATAHELAAVETGRGDLAAAGAEVASAGRPFLDVAMDKRRLYAEAAVLSLPVLPMVDPRHPGAPFPLVGKAPAGWGGRGLVVARTRDEFEARRPDDRRTLVWQPLVEVDAEVSVDLAVDGRGRWSPPAMRRRLRTSGGIAVISEDVAPEDVRALGPPTAAFVAWAARAGARGFLNLQWLRSGGRWYLSDVNPRVGTSATHWADRPSNPARWLVGSTPASSPPGPAVRTVRYLEDLPVGPALPARPRGVVFDLDDTLVPHKRWILARLALAHRRLAGRLPPWEALRSTAAQLVDEGPWHDLIDRLGSALGWEPRTTADLIEAYRAEAPRRFDPHPDVRPALQALRRRGLRLGLLTDNPPASQQAKIRACGLAEMFDAVLFTRDLGAEKPDARAFAAAAAKLALPAPALVMVGDHPYRDAIGALDAGFGGAVVVRRTGGFYNFDPGLVAACAPARALVTVPGLWALSWTIPEGRP